MRARKTPLVCVAALAALVALLPAQALGATTPSSPAGGRASRAALGSSHQLWATIDVCSAADQPDTVGVRGSMPGDGPAHDKMYMSFRLQYMDTAGKRWVNLAGAISKYIPVGAGSAARQGGWSFQLVPVPGRPAFTLRGVVSFQWRKGASVLDALSRPSSAGRHSLAGADPTGFSAATCLLG
jgi:hypothetical protein